MRILLASVALLALAACTGASQTLDLPTAGGGVDERIAATRGSALPPPAMSASASTQTAPPEGVTAGGIDFGQWRTADPATYAPAFQAQMAQRFSGQGRAQVRADLERNGFACGERTSALECRIEIMEQQCAKDWYVVIEDARTLPIAGFDVMCLGAR